MNDQINQISTSLDKIADHISNWISTKAKSAESACHDVSDEISHRVEQGAELCESAYRGVKRKATDVGVAAHDHPFSTVLVGMGVGALFTYILLRRKN